MFLSVTKELQECVKSLRESITLVCLHIDTFPHHFMKG